MKCPLCSNTIDLKKDIVNEGCSHCSFYHYLQHTLRIACFASRLIDLNENIYFKNVHQRIYNPYIIANEGKKEPVEGAIEVTEALIEQFKILIQPYAKEDLLFIMLALKELATWKIIIESDNNWAAVQVRNIAHVFTNLITIMDEEQFDIDGIVNETDFISLFVLTEEIEKISSNIYGTNTFSWKPSLEEIIKTRIENEKLNWYHKYFEVEELQKPEEIEFNDKKIIEFLKIKEVLIKI